MPNSYRFSAGALNSGKSAGEVLVAASKEKGERFDMMIANHREVIYD